MIDKKGQGNAVKISFQTIIIVLIVAGVLIFIFFQYTGRSVDTLNRALAETTLSGCPVDLNGDFPVVTEENYLLAVSGESRGSFGNVQYTGRNPEQEWKILIAQCGLCVGKEGDSEALYFEDTDLDFIPDKCEGATNVPTITPSSEWESICGGLGGDFVYLGSKDTRPRCCLAGTQEYCQEAS